MEHFLAHHYLPWVVGLAYSIFVGHWAISRTAQVMWVAIDLNPEGRLQRPSPWQPKALGLTERPLFTVALLTGNAGFIALWLGLKTAATWKSWGESQEGETRDRVVGGREVYVNFLLGTALSISFGATGAFAARLLKHQRALPALIIMAATLAGTLMLRWWIRRQGRNFLSSIPPRSL